MRTSRFAIAALVIGFLSFLTGMPGMLTGLAGMAPGFLALHHIKNDERIAGLVVGTIAVIFADTIYDWRSLFQESPEQESRLRGPKMGTLH